MAKILQVCNTDFFLVKFLAPLVRRLRELGHDVECICEGDRLDWSALGGVLPVHSLTFPKRARPSEFATAIASMRKLIRRGGYDCVDSHNRNASIVARVAAWLEGTPVRLYTAHGFYFHDDQPRVQRTLTVLLEASLARITDFTLSQSREDAERVVRQGWIDAGRIAVIGNGIDVGRFCPQPGARNALEVRLGLPPARFRVVSTGRIVEAKGFGDLLEAFGKIDVDGKQLVIVGGNLPQEISPYAAEFEARVAALGLREAVVITGLTDCVEAYLAASDVFVLASYREGLPRALIEAMAVGLPVVATDIRGCREAVVDRETGLLFPPHDVERLAALLTSLTEPAARAVLGERARSRAIGQFGEQSYVDAQVVEIERLVGRCAPPLSVSPGARDVRSSSERLR